jgi:hypothetical protein
MIDDKHLAKALITKRRQTAITIKELETQIGELRAALVHLDYTIAMFDPEASIDENLPERRQPRRNGYFAHGEIARRSLDALRLANGEPLQVRSIVNTVLAAKGLDPSDTKLQKEFHDKFKMSMRWLHKKKQVERIGPHTNPTWKIKEADADLSAEESGDHA